ncbi:MAG: hypothetical protein NZ923_10870, partial [Candidatus Kryptonium sp.]|nr:hypothetical protein [Candidatus Kryptonium sp.]
MSSTIGPFWCILPKELLLKLVKSLALLRIHLFCKRDDIEHPIDGAMPPLLHVVDNTAEFDKLNVFPGFEGVAGEKLTYRLQTLEFPNAKRVAICMIFPHHSTPEEAFESIEDLHISLVLYHHKFGDDLHAQRSLGIT